MALCRFHASQVRPSSTKPVKVHIIEDDDEARRIGEDLISAGVPVVEIEVD
jgi:hypothetical protein